MLSAFRYSADGLAESEQRLQKALHYRSGLKRLSINWLSGRIGSVNFSCRSVRHQPNRGLSPAERVALGYEAIVTDLHALRHGGIF